MPNELPNSDLARASAVYQLLSTNPGKAWKEARAALKAHPNSERVQFVAGLALIANGKRSEARAHFANAIKLGTPDPDAYLNLAQLSAETGRLDFALDVVGRAKKRFPDEVRVAQARVNAHQAVGDLAGALSAVEAALAEFPESSDLHLQQGLLLSDCGNLLQAIEALETLLKDHPDHVLSLINLGRFYAYTNQPSRALEITEQAYSMAPKSPAVIENLAIRRRENGDFKGAETLLTQLVTMDTEFADDALRQLADIISKGDLDTLEQQVQLRMKRTRAPAQLAQMEFALSAIAKRRGDDATFVKTLKRANKYVSKLRPYDARGDSQSHARSRQSYQDSDVAPASSPALPAVPIFIVGLPRSGTTLLERMISMSPHVAGLGEVALLNRFFSVEGNLKTASAESLSQLRADYAKYQTFAGSTEYSVDKMPVNYMHLGWIRKTFPEAKIILLRRDPKDLALSLFENYFNDAGQNFSFEEAGIQHRIQSFDQTVSEWKELGVEFLELNYEDLVSASEDSLKTVSAYCGVSFDDAMLRPEENEGSIRTVSSVQARKGINQDSIKRWQRYPDLLPKIF